MSVEEAGVGVSLQVKSEGNVKLELRQEETEVDKLQQILNEHAVFLQMTGMFSTFSSHWRTHNAKECIHQNVLLLFSFKTCVWYSDFSI